MTVYNSDNYEIDSSNSLSSGVVLASYLEDSNTKPVLGSETADNSSGAGATGWAQAGANVLTYDLPAGLSPDQGSCLMIMERISSPVNTFSRFFTAELENDLSQILRSGPYSVRITTNSSRGEFFNVFDMTVSSGFNSYVSTWDRSVSTTKFAYNGAISTDTPDAWSSSSISGSNLYFLNRPEGDRGLNQRAKHIIMWDRAITDAEIASIIADPYQIIKVKSSTGPSIDDIDGDNEVRAGQQNVVITGTNIENATSVTLGGQNLPIV